MLGAFVEVKCLHRMCRSLSAVPSLPQPPRCALPRCATLGQLCSEDKRRVRGLIEELARVCSEREEVERMLAEERREFEDLLTGLREQSEQLAGEKRDIF